MQEILVDASDSAGTKTGVSDNTPGPVPEIWIHCTDGTAATVRNCLIC